MSGKRAFVSVDLEGLPHIVSRLQLVPGRPLWEEAREIVTEIVARVCEVLRSSGFDEVIVADSHGDMVNLEVGKLPEYVVLVRGYPRPTSMVAGAEGSEVALMIGYHAGFGTRRAVFDHTFSGAVVRSLEFNGVRFSEYLVNSSALGHLDIPVIFLAGDENLRPEVTNYTPWVVFTSMKESLSRYSAKSPVLSKVLKELEVGIKESLRRHYEGLTKPFKIETPVTVRVGFHESGFADIAELLPIVKRVDGITVEYEARDPIEAYKILEVLIMASHGVRLMTEVQAR
ncbi:MAG: M55 family metallopeptidase [Thermoprotei archaeon]